MEIDRRFAVVLTASWLAQAVLSPLIAIGGVQPDIILIAVCTFGIFSGPAPGAVGGFIGGLGQDLLAPGSIGLGALVKTVVGYVSGKVERNLIGDNLILPMVTIGVISFISQIFYLLLLFLVGEPIDFVGLARTIAAPSAAYTAVVGFFIFPWLSRFISAERHATVFR